MVLSNCGHQLVQTRDILNKLSFDVLASYLYGDNFGSLFWRSNTI